MSVAMEFAPTVSMPAPAWPEEAWPVEAWPVQAWAAEPCPVPGPQRLAPVSVLHAPAASVPADWRLTRRGVLVVAAVVLAVGVALIWLARLSAPESTPAAPAPHVVTVAPGDTLWSIAGRVAPDTDPRAEVAALQERNGLTGVDLVPGQVLRVP